MIAIRDKELKMLDRATKEFARKALAPDRAENDQYPFAPFFSSLLQKAFDIDLFHATLPESLGGIGGGISSLCIILDNICQEDSSLGGLIFTHTAAQEIMLLAGEAEKLGEIVQRDGPEDFLLAFPSYNNPSEIPPRTSAIEKNSSYRISGPLEYLVAGGIASHGLIPAVIEGQEDYSFFLVRLPQKAVARSKPIISLGLRACPAVDIEMNQAEGKLIGEPGGGHACFQKMSDTLQVAAAAMSAGIMKGSFREALNYCKTRPQGGKKIVNWSALQMILADMAVKIRIADMSISRACQAIEAKELGWAEVSHATAIHVQASACDLTSDGVQVLGGVGYMKDFGQEKRFRDAKQLQALLGLAPMKKIRLIRRIVGR